VAGAGCADRWTCKSGTGLEEVHAGAKRLEGVAGSCALHAENQGGD
jgi:hypothetical protein